jgi:CheY-like chemotaxis protein
MPGGGRLTLETRAARLDEAFCRRHPELRPGDYAVLALADTGTGMPPEVLARIFEPFFTTKAVGRGTGLGLATVFGIVRQADGCIEVRSEVGAGTCFEVFLPVVDEAATVVAPATAANVMGRETVLLVEDEDSVRRIARRSLERAGDTVLEAPDGATALALYEDHAEEVDLLVTDVVMPGLSGRQVAEAARALQPALKVLFLSGYCDDAVLRDVVSAADEALLPKPFSPQTLARKVREVLDAA